MSTHGGRPETVEDLRDVLLRGGFVPCDSAVCGCGSWHHRYGYPERMREIQEMLDDAGHPLTNANGNLLRNAVAALIAERDALREEVAALRQQPAPVDLEQFREAVESLCNGAGSMSSAEWARRDAERKRLLAVIDSAGKSCPCGEPTCTESWEPGCGLGESVEHAVPAEREPPRGDELRAILARQPAPVVDDELPGMWSQSDFMGGATDAADNARQPAPVVDDAMVERALNAKVRNWPVRQLFDSECEARIAMRAALTAALTGARTVRGVDDASMAEWKPRNRTEAAALAKIALAHLGVVDAYIDNAIARMETDLARAQGVQS